MVGDCKPGRISGEGDAEDDAGGEAVLVGVSSVEAGVGEVEEAPVDVGKDLEVGADGDSGVEAAGVGRGDALAGFDVGSTDEGFGVGAERDGGHVEDDAGAGGDGVDARDAVGGEDGTADVDAEVDEGVVGVVEGAEGAAVEAGGVGCVELGGGEAGEEAELGEAEGGGEAKEGEEREESFQVGSRGAGWLGAEYRGGCRGFRGDVRGECAGRQFGGCALRTTLRAFGRTESVCDAAFAAGLKPCPSDSWVGSRWAGA